MTLKKARASTSKRRRRFLVGYVMPGNLVFGHGTHEAWMKNDCTDPMTRVEAERLLKTMPSPGAAIFEIVPVKVATPRR
jgi:hypothetical protein